MSLSGKIVHTGSQRISGVLHTDHAIRQAAGEYARAWGGARLASRLHSAPRTPADVNIAEDVLFPPRSP